MNPLISVIVPIYNVEKYLARCVDSIVNQTYKNLEIILVDDGSPDRCPQMCDDYAEKDSRIKVVHKKNGGLSDARNAGMAVATGEYISFIDSDDYVSDDFFECLLDVMNKENSDIAECSVVKFYDDNRFDEISDDLSVKTYDTQDAMSALIAENPFHQHVWNKLYKTELVKDIPYAVGKLNEDEFWTYRVFGRANKVARLNKTMYYYFQRNSSIMGVGYNIRRLDALEGKANRQKYIENNFPDLSTQAKIDLYGSCMFAYQSVLKFMSGAEKKKALELIRKYRKMYNLSFDEIKLADKSARKYFYLAKCNFGFCCKFRAISGIGF
ncbi:MAG: glycosyltransferase [Ruminococcus bromii]|nr:glycosyltransferase [Ruminococcus bromii]MBD9012340.1 glycosyltransferase [Ruminococcus bromii]